MRAHALKEIEGTMTTPSEPGDGRPGLLVEQDGAIVVVMAFEVTGDRITRLRAVRNPDKLRQRTG
ncbi:hypothetical protein ACQP2K_19965 [Microbispora siamensis]